MKIKIKDLKPNPFRDIKNYPISEKKVQSLIKSIKQTFFWDNILARKSNGKIEIAYGHHRMIALQRTFKPDYIVDIPVKNFDERTMFLIMANENDEEWETNPQIDEETVKGAIKFLKEHPEEIEKLKTEKSVTAATKIGPTMVFKFLGGNWYRERVSYAFDRLGLSTRKGRERVEPKAFKPFKRVRHTRTYAKAVRAVKGLTPKQQLKGAEKIAEKEDYSEAGMKSVLLEEKFKFKKDKGEKKIIEFGDFIDGCAKDMEKLNRKLEKLVEFKEEFDSETYNKSLERWGFNIQGRSVIKNLKKLGGSNEHTALPRNV